MAEHLHLKKWPSDDQVNNKEVILIGFITSGNTTNRHKEKLFIEPQSSYFNNGALTVAIEEINNSTEVLPNHNVCLCYQYIRILPSKIAEQTFSNPRLLLP